MIEFAQPYPEISIVTIVSEPLGVLRAEMRARLRELLAEAEDSPDVRAVVVTGRGRAFSVGSDIGEFTQDPEPLREAVLEEQVLHDALESSPLPIVAACNGLTLGGGAELALACDIRIAASSARFGFPEVKAGAFAGAGATQRLPAHIGMGRALELLLTGRILDADEALAIGLVHAVVPDDALPDRALELSRSLAELPAAALAASKECTVVGVRKGRSEGAAREVELTVAVGSGPDAAEGQAAFIEKRQPRFERKRRVIRPDPDGRYE